MGTRKSKTIAEKEDLAKKAISMQLHKMKMPEICKILEVNNSTLSKWLIAYRAGEYKISKEKKSLKRLIGRSEVKSPEPIEISDYDTIGIHIKLNKIMEKVEFLCDQLSG